MFDMFPCDLDITPDTFSDVLFISYEIELYPARKKIGFLLLYDYEFTIPYTFDTIPNSQAGHKLPTQA